MEFRPHLLFTNLVLLQLFKIFLSASVGFYRIPYKTRDISIEFWLPGSLSCFFPWHLFILRHQRKKRIFYCSLVPLFKPPTVCLEAPSPPQAHSYFASWLLTLPLLLWLLPEILRFVENFIFSRDIFKRLCICCSIIWNLLLFVAEKLPE